MAGFFKKALGVFVEVPDSVADGPAVDPEQLSAEARDLIAQIEAGSHSDDASGSYDTADGGGPPSAEQRAATDGMDYGLPFDEIYARAGVPGSPYTAEMLLKVAEGLKALPLAQARAAVEAMDSADDRWSVADVMLDADRKIDALRDIRRDMESRTSAAQQLFDRTTAALDQQLTANETEIRSQIAELQALLMEANQTAATEKARAMSELEAERQGAANEIQRLDAHIQMLGQVHTFFGSGGDAGEPGAG